MLNKRRRSICTHPLGAKERDMSSFDDSRMRSMATWITSIPAGAIMRLGAFTKVQRGRGRRVGRSDVSSEVSRTIGLSLAKAKQPPRNILSPSHQTTTSRADSVLSGFYNVAEHPNCQNLVVITFHTLQRIEEKTRTRVSPCLPSETTHTMNNIKLLKQSLNQIGSQRFLEFADSTLTVDADLMLMVAG